MGLAPVLTFFLLWFVLVDYGDVTGAGGRGLWVDLVCSGLALAARVIVCRGALLVYARELILQRMRGAVTVAHDLSGMTLASLVVAMVSAF